MKKILFISDFNFRGSGYLNISVPICDKLGKLGYDVKAIGLGNGGEEHNFKFSIIPCISFDNAYVMVNNLNFQWQPDLLIVALDIPHQLQFSNLCKNLKLKMIAITPLENPPLTFTWATLLNEIEKVFFISQLGANAALEAGVESAEHLVVGMDTESWRMRTQEEYVKGREALNISPDTFVVLTIADNQERKNLSKAFEIVGELKKRGTKIKYVLVTRENSDVGWNLRDLAMYYGIASEVMIFERGVTFKQIYSMYAIADAFLLTSKAEGLNMAVLESMCIGVPVVATACGSMPELLSPDRGFLMETEYSLIDPWGNSRRDFPRASNGADWLQEISNAKGKIDLAHIVNARKYMKTRTWDKPIQQLVEAIEKPNEEQK